MRYFGLILEQLLSEEFDKDKFFSRLTSVMTLVRRGAGEGERDAARHAKDRMVAVAYKEMTKWAQKGSGVTPEQIASFKRTLDSIVNNNKPEETPKPKAKPDPEPTWKPKYNPAFKVGAWVFIRAGFNSLLDNRVGRIVGMTFDKSDQMAYRIEFEDKKVFAMTCSKIEPFMSKATQEQMDAMASRKAKTSSTNEKPKEEKPREDTKTKQSAYGFDIFSLAHYFEETENSNKVYGIVKKDNKYYTFWGGYQKPLSLKMHPDVDAAAKQYNSKLKKGYKKIVLPFTDSLIEDKKWSWINDAVKAAFRKIGESDISLLIRFCNAMGMKME